jgi:hypothetical protein
LRCALYDASQRRFFLRHRRLALHLQRGEQIPPDETVVVVNTSRLELAFN